MGETLSCADTPKSSRRWPMRPGRALPQPREDLGHQRRLGEREVIRAILIVDVAA